MKRASRKIRKQPPPPERELYWIVGLILFFIEREAIVDGLGMFAKLILILIYT